MLSESLFPKGPAKVPSTGVPRTTKPLGLHMPQLICSSARIRYRFCANCVAGMRLVLFCMLGIGQAAMEVDCIYLYFVLLAFRL